MSDQIDYNQLAAAILSLGSKTEIAGLLPIGANGANQKGGVNEEKVSTASVGVESVAGRSKLLGEKKTVEAQVPRQASTTTGSWADDDGFYDLSDARCQSSSESSVSGGVGGLVTDAVKRSVVFGQGLGDAALSAGPQDVSVGGYYQQVVRGPNTKRLIGMLRDFGVVVPKTARSDLAICTYAAGAMPDSVHEGQRKLRMLALVGDRAIALHIAVAAHVAGGTVGGTQQVVNRQTSDDYLRDVMVKTNLRVCVSYPPLVDEKSAKTTATAFEAIVGVLALHAAPEVVSAFLQKVGVLS